MLYAISELLGVLHVLPRHRGNAFDVDFVEGQRFSERDGSQNRQLVRGIDPFDVEARIGFCVAELLRFGEHVVEVAALVAHLGQNEVSGTVDDAGNPLDTVSGESLADRLDNRNASGDRRLERDHDAASAGGLEYFVPVQRDERLVCGDHVLSRFDGPHGEIPGELGSAEELDDDADLGVVDHGGGILANHDAFERARPRLGDVARARVHDLDGASGAARDLLSIAREHVHRAAPHGAQTEQTDLDWLHYSLTIIDVATNTTETTLLSGQAAAGCGSRR